jgi:hypothetical protein
LKKNKKAVDRRGKFDKVLALLTATPVGNEKVQSTVDGRRSLE